MQHIVRYGKQHLMAIAQTPQNEKLGASSLKSIFYSVKEHQSQCMLLWKATLAFVPPRPFIDLGLKTSSAAQSSVCSDGMQWFFMYETHSKHAILCGEAWFELKIPSFHKHGKAMCVWWPSHKLHKTRALVLPTFNVYPTQWRNTRTNAPLLQKAILPCLFPTKSSPRIRANECLHFPKLFVNWLFAGGFHSLKPTPNMFSFVKKSDLASKCLIFTNTEKPHIAS